MTRIVAGEARGRPLGVPAGRGTRPTTDRAREALFSTLDGLVDLAGARFLDLFAGSGAVGLEALSRGAGEVVLVESDAGASRVIGDNVVALGMTGARVVRDRVERFLETTPQVFDVVFADPPYERDGAAMRQRLPGPALRWLDRSGLRSRRRAPHQSRRLVLAGRNRLAEVATLWRGHPLVRSPIMRRAVCPGSFDPVTNGHTDIIGRASRLVDELVVGVLVNKSKSSLFTVDERIEMLKEVTAEYGNVVVDSFYGLLVDYCTAHHIRTVIKGLRAVSDFDYELQMAQMNHGLAGVETLFMATNPLYSFLSSSLVKEIATYGGDVSAHVPESVRARLVERLPIHS